MNNIIIECPRCKKQYHFQEIVMPKTIFQELRGILRDDAGKIIDIIGDNEKMEELYFCTKCDAPIKVNIKLEFETSIESKYDFSIDSKTIIK